MLIRLVLGVVWGVVLMVKVGRAKARAVGMVMMGRGGGVRG